MNKIILTGRLTKDPELKTVGDGKKVCNITLAVKRPFNREKTDFFRCNVWHKQAEIMNQYARKGDQLIIEGYLTTTTKDNQKFYDINIENFEFGKIKNKVKDNNIETKNNDIDENIEELEF